MGLLPPATLNQTTAPYAEAARALAGDRAAAVIALGAAISCFGALNGWILIVGQLPLAVAKDGLFPAVFSRVSRHGTPAIGLLIGSTLATLLIAAELHQGTGGALHVHHPAGDAQHTRAVRVLRAGRLSDHAGRPGGSPWGRRSSPRSPSPTRCGRSAAPAPRSSTGAFSSSLQGSRFTSGSFDRERDRAVGRRRDLAAAVEASARGLSRCGIDCAAVARAELHRAAGFCHGDRRIRSIRRSAGASAAPPCTFSRLIRYDGPGLDLRAETRRSSAIAARSSAAWESRRAEGEPAAQKTALSCDRLPDCRRHLTAGASRRRRRRLARSPNHCRRPGLPHERRGHRAVSRSLLGDSIDELIVVPLPHWRGPGGRLPPDVDHQPDRSRSGGRLLTADAGRLPGASPRSRDRRLSKCPMRSSTAWARTYWPPRRDACLMLTGNPIDPAPARERREPTSSNTRETNISLKGGGGPTCLTRPLLRDRFTP